MITVAKNVTPEEVEHTVKNGMRKILRNKGVIVANIGENTPKRIEKLAQDGTLKIKKNNTHGD